MTRYIGLSLSFCVSDICKGRVAVGDVEKIVTGTRARNDAEWNALLEEYGKTYWKGYKKQAYAVVADLRARGAIEQPRVHGEEPHNIADGHWLSTP